MYGYEPIMGFSHYHHNTFGKLFQRIILTAEVIFQIYNLER